jgi:NitT/TauT family transport system ATP-binding protein
MTTSEQLGCRDALVVEDLGVTFKTDGGPHEVLGGVHLRVEPGEFVCVVGPSGVGKSTLLQCISGLMKPTHGTVTMGDRPVLEPRQEIGLVFQDYRGTLMPWLRTRDNVALPLQGRGVRRRERLARAQESLAAVGLPDVGHKYPWQLSGGMQQRVAMARALAYKSELLLMDEPFGSLDAQTRMDLEDLVIDLRKRLGLSIVVITHDIDEAVYLADRVVVLRGRPATVIDVVDIEFGVERDQIGTKSDPRFLEYRNRILKEIRH